MNAVDKTEELSLDQLFELAQRVPTVIKSKAEPLSQQSYKNPIFVGIAGGTASGKTTVCEEIFQRVKMGSQYSKCVMLPLDCFYKECTPEQMANISNVNFDHPEIFDWELLIQTL